MKLIYRHLIAFLFILLCNNFIYSQGLSIGEQVPDLEFENVLNYSKEKLKLSDFKGKLIIFDFWSFWCSPCIKNFPKMEYLQKKYKDQIQIIMVNYDSKEKTVDFFKSRKHVKIPGNVALITSDTILKRKFQHIGVPYYAWVNESGKLIYSTHEDITSEIIDRHLNGEANIYNKKAGTKYIKTLFEQDYAPYVKYGTMLLKGIDSLEIHLNNGKHNLGSYCRSIVDLYQFAYNESDKDVRIGFKEYGRTILEVSNKEKYEYQPGTNYDEWRGKYGYYYESILPSHLEAERYKIMQEDLRRQFGLQVTIEKRPVKCLAMVRTSTIDKLKTKGGSPSESSFLFSEHAPDSFNYKSNKHFLINKPFKDLVNKLKSFGNYHWGIKVVDSTNYNGNIDFEMNIITSDSPGIHEFQKVLNKYDLALVEKYILLDVLVLRE